MKIALRKLEEVENRKPSRIGRPQLSHEQKRVKFNLSLSRVAHEQLNVCGGSVWVERQMQEQLAAKNKNQR